jgi:hypothetical protein
MYAAPLVVYNYLEEIAEKMRKHKCSVVCQ